MNSSPTPHSAPRRNGGQILVQALAIQGVDAIHCVPGESFLPVLDALRDHPGIRTVVTRHEGAAANMAEADGKLTGRPGICFVTRGPGASHATNGVLTAREDSTPMILFIGQVDTGVMGREAFQEVDYRQMYGGIAKWATQIEQIDRIPEVVARAFSVALSGRPGPVVVALPDNVLFGHAQVADGLPVRISQPAPGARDLAELQDRLTRAQRPLLVIGGSGWTDEACADIARFAQAHDLPVAASFRRQDLLDNRSRHYVGQLGLAVSPRLAERVRQADLLLVVGARLGEVSSGGYSVVESPEPKQTLIHLHADPQELNRVYRATLPICTSMTEAARALASLPATDSAPWQDWTRQARADHEAHATVPSPAPGHQGVDLGAVMAWLGSHLPDDAVIANGAGNYTVWIHRFYPYRQRATELAPTNGAMGYGLPAAIAAKLRHPRRTVVCLSGDGCFMMYPQELATALQFGAAVITVIVNNGMLGTIRMHQEREFPGRVHATDLLNPDFVALAQAFGAHGERVERTEAFPEAFERAQACGRAAVIELNVDPLQITPQVRLASR